VRSLHIPLPPFPAPPQICGVAATRCNPDKWVTYDGGTVVVSWGTAPPCGGSDADWVLDPCLNATTVPQAACPTAPCHVPAAPLAPAFNITALDPTNPSGGFQLWMNGSTGSATDPYTCDYDPDTGEPFPWQTVYTFTCDPTVPADGPARVVSVTQSPADVCLVLVEWATALACLA